MLTLKTNKEVYEFFQQFYPEVAAKLREAFAKEGSKDKVTRLSSMLNDSILHLADERKNEIEIRNSGAYWQR